MGSHHARTPRARHRARSPAGRWHGGVLLGLVTVGLVAAVAVPALVGSSNDAGEAADGGDDRSTPCRTQVAAAGVLVSAIRTGIAHLEVHLGARGDWAVGDLETDETASQYQSTRSAGPEDLARHDDARRAYDETVGRDPQACSGRTTGCARRLSALADSIEAGRAGLEVWDQRLARLAATDESAGERDPALAQERWEATRAELPRVLADWYAAESALEQAPRCA